MYAWDFPWENGVNNAIGQASGWRAQDDSTEDGSGAKQVGAIGYEGSEYPREQSGPDPLVQYSSEPCVEVIKT